MKSLRKLAGISILLTLVFMVIALIRFQREEEMAFLPDQFELYYNEDWLVVSLDGAAAAGGEWEEHGRIQELIRAELEGEDCRKEDLPYKGKCGAGDLVVYKNMVSGQYAGLTLSFETVDAKVRVVLDGEVIYQYGFEGDGEPTGRNKNFAELPKEIGKGELWIELASPRPDAAAMLESVMIETRDRVIIGVFGSNIGDIGCCLLIVMMAIIMFVIAMIRRYTRQPARGEIFLGLAGLVAGVYCFIGTDTLSIFYDIQGAYEMQEYLALLVPLFLALYFERNMHVVYPRRFFVLLSCMSLHAVVQISLHLLEVKDLKDMGNVSAVAVAAVCLVAIASLIQYDYENRSYQTVLPVLSMLVLLAGGTANMILNTVFDGAYGNAAGQYSMAVFGIMMAVMHILQLSKEYRISAEENAQLLEEKVKMVQRQNVQLAQAKEEADTAKHEALAANEAKGKFLAHMSHEIRTPINAVLGMDEMILRESGEANIKEYAMDIYMAGQTLLTLINDILDFSKIESGKMEIVPAAYDVSSMIHDLTTMAWQRAKDKNIGFVVEIDREIPSRLYGDDVRIRQALTNILTNAVKYTHEGSVWFRAGCRSMEEGEVYLAFEVEDTGIGMKEEDLPKLSAEFERIEEDRNRNIEGTGLGMSITIQLLELMGSRLHVESEYGKGSKFSFELGQKVVDGTPIGDFESRVRQAAEDYSHSTKFYAPEAKILVVDDNAVNRKVLRNLLKGTQVQVTDAGSGAECLELVQRSHFDLIFLDHMMPGMDGVETLHRMKGLSGYHCQDTPVIVLTANAVTGARENYLAEGFDDFLSKPVVPEKLEGMMRRMLPQELLHTGVPQGMGREGTGPQGLEAGGGGNPGGSVGKPGSTGRQITEAGNPGMQGICPEGAGQERDVRFSGTGAPGAAWDGPSGTGAPGRLPDNLPQVDGLDWNYAWLHLPDMELLEYTAREFYAQLDPAADSLEQAYMQIAEPGQADRYRIQVHAMKSLAATLGIIPLAGVAKVLEYAARDGKIDVIMSMTGVFLEEWRSYREKLQGVFGIGTEERKEVADYSVMQALVEMVRLSMQEMDIDQADRLMGELQAYEYPEGMGQDIRRMAEAVMNLDPEETERLAGLLIGRMAEAGAGE